MPEMTVTRAQYEQVLAVLGLDPATTLSVNIAPDFFRVVHTDAAVAAGPIVQEEDA